MLMQTYGYCWNETKPGWIIRWYYNRSIISIAPCCANRIPNCTEQSKFTGTGKTRNANGELVGPGNVKNRTCVARRCQCPNCP